MIKTNAKNLFGLLLVVGVCVSGVSAEENIASLLVQKDVLEKEIEAVNKEYQPKLEPLQNQLRELQKEIREKTQKQTAEMNELELKIAAEFKKLLPTGKQSYGDFTWDCHAGSWISVNAKNKDGKQTVWAQVFYRPEMTKEEQKAYSKNTCCGYPAKRYADKWVWIQCGKTEIRFGLSDKSLESDAILDAIVGSFDLDAISQL